MQDKLLFIYLIIKLAGAAGVFETGLHVPMPDRRFFNMDNRVGISNVVPKVNLYG